MADRRKAKTKRKPRRPVSQAQARLFGVVARKGAVAAVKMRPGEMSRPEARSTLRGVAVSALPPRKRSSKPTPAKPTPTQPKPAPTPRPKRTRTAAQRAATRKRNARRAAGL